MTTTKINKPFYLVTYIIALLCLIAGLAAPLFGGEFLIVKLVDAFKVLIGTDGASFIGTATLFSFNFDVGALFALIYALVTVVGIVLLVPAFIGKEGKAAKGVALTMEVIAVITLLMVLINTIGYSTSMDGIMDILSIVIALGGTLLMLIIQSIAMYKGSGVVKTVMAILGVVGLAALLNVTVLGIPASIGSMSDYFAGNYFASDYTGAYTLQFFLGNLFNDFVFGTNISVEADLWIKVCSVCAALTALVVIINAALDILFLAKKSSKGVLVFDCVRYCLECLLAVLTLVTLFIIDSADPGLLIVVITAISFIAAVISIIRAVAYPEKVEEDEGAEYGADAYAEDGANTVNVVPVDNENDDVSIIYAGEIQYKEKEPYNGPVDSFISRLTDAEKKEFANIFLDKIYGPYEGVPDYIVDGDNADFFRSVFAYLGTFRPIVSDGLMNKLYSELNLLN